MADKNATGVPAGLYRRCWPYHLAMKPFYHLTTDHWQERATYALIGVWRAWLVAKLRAASCPKFEVAQAILGFGTELFRKAQEVGALKVADCPNSHPVTLQSVWQSECDLWCPGAQLPIPGWMFARMARELELADLVLCPSEFVRESMVSNGVPVSKCFLNPYGVDASIFGAERNGPPPAAVRFISVGAISLRKGHQYLFRAFEKVKQAIPEAELICVGDYKADFRKELPRWSGQFRHYPKLSHPELAKLLPTCTAFTLTSVEEGFARAIPEAMAAGLPIVATYQTGATSLVNDGVEGLIVPARDPEKTAQAMIQLASDSAACQRMGDAARKKVTAGNSWQDYGDRLLAEYKARMTKSE
jgi:glycosyltransferase involved in cell wall biosynthesis